MDYSEFRHMTFTRRERILTITLNRPPMNPIHYELHNELARLWYKVQLDHDADVVVLTGAGEVFSAGGDIPMMQKRIDDPELFNQKNLEMKKMIFGLLDLEKPVIARINGDCIGLGATIALMGVGPEREPRLHFEIRRDGQPIDPLLFLRPPAR